MEAALEVDRDRAEERVGVEPFNTQALDERRGEAAAASRGDGADVACRNEACSAAVSGVGGAAPGEADGSGEAAEAAEAAEAEAEAEVEGGK